MTADGQLNSPSQTTKIKQKTKLLDVYSIARALA